MSSNETLDRFWDAFRAGEPSAQLGGIDADKPGYHEKRNDLIARGEDDDYSIAQVVADRRGSGDVASAIDLTLPAAKMTLYTGRLRAAALAQDERLWPHGGPTLREYIGTTNGVDVECYVFTGGVPLGVGADSGFDAGRDDTHLWHIHLSVIRQYSEDWDALDAVLSVLKGETLAAWRARTEEDVTPEQDNRLKWVDARLEAIGTGLSDIADDRPGAGQDVWIVRELKALRADITELKARPTAGPITVDQAQLEAALKKVFGSLDGATPSS